MSTNAFTTRRDFLKGSAAATGALVIGFTLPMTSRFAPGCGRRRQAQPPALHRTPSCASRRTGR